MGSESERFAGALQAIMPNNIQLLPPNEGIQIFAKALDASIKNSNKSDFPIQMWITSPDNIEQILALEDRDKPTIDRLEPHFSKSVGKL